ncbi:MAG: hypothetical protein QM490_00905, partial [Candidatus Gracilibacteria bacterium]
MVDINSGQGKPLIIDVPSVVTGEYPCGFKNKEDLEGIKDKFEKLGLFEDHSSIDGVKIGKINRVVENSLESLPSEILELIDDIKGKTLEIFDFCLVKTEKNIDIHRHPDGVGEVYFGGDGGVEVITKDDLANTYHLKK